MFRLLGVIAGIISLTILAWKGFNLPFGVILDRLLGVYEREMSALFQLAEPFINTQLSVLRECCGWPLQLFPHWKHVFVLTWLYFGADTRARWEAGGRGLALYSAVVGGVVAAITGVAAGTVPLNEMSANFWIVLIPGVGFLTYMLLMNVWLAAYNRVYLDNWAESFWSRFPFLDLLGVVLVVVLAMRSKSIPFLATMPNPGLALLGLLVVYLAILNMLEVILSWASFRPQQGGSLSAYWSDPDTQAGLLVLTTILGALGVATVGLITG